MRVLLSYRPFSASGPGWANSGIVASLLDRETGNVEERWIQREDFTRDMEVLFPILLQAYMSMEALVAARLDVSRREA